MMDTIDTRRGRRSWSDTQKRAIVAASLEPGTSVSVIARRYDVTTNLLFIWRRLYHDGLLAEPGAGGPSLLPVTITGEQAEKLSSVASDAGRVEIEMSPGYRIAA
ncbi:MULTISPECIES: transposase [Hyphomicrobiales]|uniref:IS66-like element accessory protein TnpA n=1 Tax=Methylobacterium sp. CCH7-A2 TaxID=1768789 RepID=UPI0018D1FA28|nr:MULTISPECIES: transposase [Hyphomicrobiales]